VGGYYENNPSMDLLSLIDLINSFNPKPNVGNLIEKIPYYSFTAASQQLFPQCSFSLL
jgi:hypothetical protein